MLVCYFVPFVLLHKKSLYELNRVSSGALKHWILPPHHTAFALSPRSRRLSRLSLSTGLRHSRRRSIHLSTPISCCHKPTTELSKAPLHSSKVPAPSGPPHLPALTWTVRSPPPLAPFPSLPFRPTTATAAAYSRSAGGHRPTMTSTITTTVGCGGLLFRPSSTKPRGQPRRCAVRAQGTFCANPPNFWGGVTQFLSSPG